MACELVNYYNCQIFNFTHHYTMIMITLHPTSSSTVVIQCAHLIFLRLTFLRMTHPTMMRAVAMTTGIPTPLDTTLQNKQKHNIQTLILCKIDCMHM